MTKVLHGKVNHEGDKPGELSSLEAPGDEHGDGPNGAESQGGEEREDQ